MNSTYKETPLLGAMASEIPEPMMNPTILIDTFLPGFSFFTNAVSKYFGLDIGVYLPIILVVCGVKYVADYLQTWFWDTIDTYFMSTVDIRVDDEMYNMVMSWVANQRFAQRSRRFIANTDTNSRSWVMWRDSWGDEEEADDTNVEFDENGVAIAGTGKNKGKKVRFTPSFGEHYFWYKNRLLIFRRKRDTHQINVGTASELEEISIQSYGRSPNILKELLAECRMQFLENDFNKTVIYRGGHKNGSSEVGWTRCAARVSRPFSTVVLDEKVKQGLVTDMREYLHQDTRRWYSNRGIPYRRGYLFYGPPGTGKSSLSFAIAGYFKLKIYVVSLNSGSITEDVLGNLFSELPKQCVVLLEDIDTAGMTRSRNNDEAEDQLKPLFTDKGIPVTLPKAGTQPGPNSNKISLSALLNILDGVASQEGRILIMTTNHVEKLDEALIRPGRVDMKIKFDLASTEMITTIFKAIFTTLESDLSASFQPSTLPIRAPKAILSSSTVPPSTTALEFSAETIASNLATKKAGEEKILALSEQIANIIPGMKFSPAEVQGYLLKHKCKPETAVLEASGWVEKTLEEKKQKEDKENETKAKAKAKAKATEEETWEERMWALGVDL